jgi:hypothetical protein
MVTDDVYRMTTTTLQFRSNIDGNLLSFDEDEGEP